VGAGGIGAPALLYLAGSGVGTIGVIDHDAVETSNLHRQIIHCEARVGLNKALSAKIALEAFNSSVKVIAHAERL
jgi:adenylyltransferase/sulfurtransferase